MKRLLVLLCAAALLCGCAPVPAPATEPAPAPTQENETAAPVTEPVETLPPETAPAGTDPTEAAPEEELPYTVSLHAAVPIYGAPSYDDFCLGVVAEDGVYTIVEEVTDAEGNLWGRLKSGAGWVDLSALDMNAPVTAAFADERLLQSGGYEGFTAEESEYLTLIAFRARETLTDVRLVALEPDWERGDGYTESRVLYTLPALDPDKPLVAGVVFYGDLTAYGLTFTDAGGTVRCFAVTVSGRNGALVTEEYVP